MKRDRLSSGDGSPSVKKGETGMTEKIRKDLFDMRDEKYRDFQSKLVPNIEKETIIGVRTPDLRNYAKQLIKSGDHTAFLGDLPHRYYDENQLHAFIISEIKDFDTCISEVERFLPYVDCWPVSDQATPKAFGKNHPKLLPYIKKWISSEHVYTSRFGIRMLMNEFLGDDFDEEYHEIVASKSGDDYYLKMMIAWYFATALAKQYEATVPFLEKKRLDGWTHNKAIQKALESYRVTPERKEYLKSLKCPVEKSDATLIGEK